MCPFSTSVNHFLMGVMVTKCRFGKINMISVEMMDSSFRQKAEKQGCFSSILDRLSTVK